MSFEDFNFNYFFKFDFKRVSFKMIKFTIASKNDSEDNNITFNIMIKLTLSNDS